MAIGGSKTTDPKESVYEFVDQVNKSDLSGNNNDPSNSGATWQTSVKKFYDGATYFNGSALLISQIHRTLPLVLPILLSSIVIRV